MFVNKLIIVTLVSFGFMAQAQQEANINSLPVDLQADIDANTNNGELRRAADPNVVRVQDDRVTAPNSGVVILNSQTATSDSQAQSVLQQPTTYVQASPLTDSRAEQLRRARQAAEVNTEQKIVEKLESARLEDERDRANRLFGEDRWEKKQPVVQQPPVPTQPVPVYGQYEQPKQTVEVVNVDSDKEDLSSVKDEIIEAVKEVQAERVALEEYKKKPEKKDRYYIGGLLGLTEYNADNVENNGSGGFTVGTYLASGVIIEGSFLYSNHYLDQWWRDYDFFKEVDQYNFALAAKYSPLKGNIKPFAGAHIGYTHRRYTDRSFEASQSFNSRDRRYRSRAAGQYPTDEEVTSNAVDMGFLVGLDFLLSDNFAIGAEYRYTMNMFNRSDSDFINNGDWRAPSNSEPLEDIDYSVFGISGKFTF